MNPHLIMFPPRQIGLQICTVKAKSVDKLCKIVKKQLVVAEGEIFEIVTALEEEFGISIGKRGSRKEFGVMTGKELGGERRPVGRRRCKVTEDSWSRWDQEKRVPTSVSLSRVRKERERAMMSRPAVAPMGRGVADDAKTGRRRWLVRRRAGVYVCLIPIHYALTIAEEDTLLQNYVATHGDGHWNSIARCAGTYYTLSIRLKRSGKSCRLRWLNYLRPDVRRGNITLQEQITILDRKMIF
ncbi:hypothetical protein V8G54_033906 [Vigna mungo]|uniref:Uncharacterized protein n=1 Tax=Vigna mungo TaxID=3915 RepID=A0AAQ3RGS0_VIGMU